MFRKNIWVMLIVFSLVAAEIFPARALAEEREEVFGEQSSGVYDYEEGEVIVTIVAPYKTSLTEEGTDSLDPSITVEGSLDFGGLKSSGKNKVQRNYREDTSLYVVEATSEKYSTAELIEQLEDRDYVVSVEPNYKHRMMGEKKEIEKNAKTSGNHDLEKDDNGDKGVNLRDYQWYLDGGRTGSEGINWSDFDQSTIKEEPVVAVVDSGVDFTHEDLKDNMWINTTEELEGTYGYDCVSETGDPVDSDGHGTHCAGIIGGNGGETGIQGVCGKVKLMALNIFDEDGADSYSILRAYNYIYKAQQSGVNVAAVNCSWGGGTTTNAEKVLIDKIGKAGALFVFASGNDGNNWEVTGKKQTPYDIDSEYAVIIGSTDTADRMSSFSDYGKNSVNFFAPGSQILSDVSYDEFYPLLLSEKRREESCLFFSSGEEGDVTLSDFNGVKSVTHDRENVYGDSESGSYRFVLEKPDRFEKRASLYIDVTDYNLSSAEYFYVCCDYGYELGGQIVWETRYYEQKPSDLKVISGKTYVCILSEKANPNTNPVVYMDNFAVSVPNLSDDYMVKYEQYSGTSMAAPVVSGAVAVLAGLRVNDSALARKELLFNCLRKNDSLADKSIQGGIIDMSKMSEIAPDTDPNKTNPPGETPVPTDSAVYTPYPNRTSAPGPVSTDGAVYTSYPSCTPASSPVPTVDTGADKSNSGTGNKKVSKKISVKKVKLNRKNAKLKVGKKLKLRAVITPENATDKRVKWYVKKSDRKYVKVSKKGVVTAKKKGKGRKVKVYAMAGDGSKKKAYCMVKIR